MLFVGLLGLARMKLFKQTNLSINCFKDYIFDQVLSSSWKGERPRHYIKGLANFGVYSRGSFGEQGGGSLVTGHDFKVP